MSIKQLIAYLEKLAPNKLAVSWDNTGLLVGLPHDEVQKVLVTLDVTPQVVEYAIEIKADLIISHHPYFREAKKKINDELIIKLIRERISLYCMHTNLDFIKNGVNKALASLIGLNDTEFLTCHPEVTTYHIAVYTPGDNVIAVSEAVFQAGAGIIGNYSHCLNRYDVQGQFKPLEGSNPTVGNKNSLEKVEEVKLEFYADTINLDKVLSAMISAHSYETPAYSVYPLQQENQNYGLGLVGTLSAPFLLKDLAVMVRDRLEAPFVKLWTAGKTSDSKVQKVAVCGGNGSDLIGIASQKAEVFISADFTYHKVIGSPVPLIDAGHFFTENPVLKLLEDYLQPLNLEVNVFNSQNADIQKLIIL